MGGSGGQAEHARPMAESPRAVPLPGVRALQTVDRHGVDSLARAMDAAQPPHLFMKAKPGAAGDC